MTVSKNTKFEQARREAEEEYLLRLAAIAVAEQDEEEFAAAVAAAQDTPETEFAAFDAKLEQLLAADRRRRRARRLPRALAGLAACLALLVGTHGIAYAGLPDYQAFVNNVILEMKDGYAVLVSGGTQASGVLAPKDWQGGFRPGWVPERFDRVQGEQAEVRSSLVYTSEQDAAQQLVIHGLDTATCNIDQDGVLEEKRTMVQGVEAYQYRKEDEPDLCLVFVKEGYAIHILGTVTEDELLQIAESIVFE